MVNSVQALKGVLQTKCYSFVKPGYYERVVAEIAGRGILFMEGDEHRKARKLLGSRPLDPHSPPFKTNVNSYGAAPFSFGNIKRLLPWFHQKATEMTTIMNEQLKGHQSKVIEGTDSPRLPSRLELTSRSQFQAYFPKQRWTLLALHVLATS